MRATVRYGAKNVRFDTSPTPACASRPTRQPVPFDWAGQVAAFLMTDTLCEGGIRL
jgi:hypothetical protein